MGYACTMEQQEAAIAELEAHGIPVGSDTLSLYFEGGGNLDYVDSALQESEDFYASEAADSFEFDLSDWD